MSDYKYSEDDLQLDELNSILPILDGHDQPDLDLNTFRHEDQDKQEEKDQEQTASMIAIELFREALNNPDHRTSLILPEHHHKLRTSDSLFDYPLFRWTPENFFSGGIVPCVHCSTCQPKGKDILTRLADENAHRTRIIYTKYICQTTKKQFNTVGQNFFSKITITLANTFPYYLTRKGGFSKALKLDLEYNILGPNGLEPFLRSLKQARTEIWTYLCDWFSARMETQYSNTDPDLHPTPHKLASYLKQQDVFDGKGLLDAWMELTTGIEDIAAAVMQMCEAKKSISIDATGKFPSKIGVKEKGTDNWITPTEMKWLNIIQNEIGQILHIKFISSESHDNLGPCFEKVLANAKEEGWAPTADRPLFLITDNANSLKNLVRDKMPHFIIKQDPWHLINRSYNPFELQKKSVTLRKDSYGQSTPCSTLHR
ncbi:hypothetical protein DFS34DRAFT_409911 [Phlyctochytrium arcticum]|nr:hypothetical protein DFS34DRAFT_409911 [Phlyctochytrium arcticum]